MISYGLYKWLHLLGVFLVMFSLGGRVLLSAGSAETRNRFKALAGITNGIGLIVILLAGFGLLTKLVALETWPGWLFAKILIWLAFAVLFSIAGRDAGKIRMLWWTGPLLAALAAYLAIFKPF